MEEVESPSVAVEQEAAANRAEIAALEEREPVPEVGAEREAPRATNAVVLRRRSRLMRMGCGRESASKR
jgi:hypothetical protein